VDVHGCFRKVSDEIPKGYFNTAAGAGDCSASVPCIQKSGNTWKTTGDATSTKLNAYAAIPRSSYADYDPSTKAVQACSDPSKTVEQCTSECSHLGYSASAVTSHTTPDTTGWPAYDCTSPATSGTFILSGHCTLSAEVSITGELTIVGSSKDMSALKTMTAATGSRHFSLNSESDKLHLWHVKLTGGSASDSGGAIEVRVGLLNLYYSELSGNTASEGGAIVLVGESETNKNAVINSYGSLFKNNEALRSGGAIMLLRAVGTFVHSTIDSNNAKGTYDYGGGLLIKRSEVIMTNSTVSNNEGFDGDGVATLGYVTLTLRQSTFSGNGIYIDSPSLDQKMFLINTVIAANNIDISTPYNNDVHMATCADNPCSVPPHTGTCAAVDATDPKLGVMCNDVTATEQTCGTIGGTWSGTVLPTRCDSHDACKAACNEDSTCEIYQGNLYYDSTKVFGGANCTDPAGCKAQCTADADCEGWSSACSDTSKTTEDTCGVCSNPRPDLAANSTVCHSSCEAMTSPDYVPSESTCGICSDTSKESDATCVGSCSDSSKPTQADCVSSCSIPSYGSTQLTCLWTIQTSGFPPGQTEWGKGTNNYQVPTQTVGCVAYKNMVGYSWTAGRWTNLPSFCSVKGTTVYWNAHNGGWSETEQNRPCGYNGYNCVLHSTSQSWTNAANIPTWDVRTWTDRSWTSYEYTDAIWSAGTWDSSLASSYVYGSESAATGGTSQVKAFAYGPEGLEASASSHKKPSSDFCDNKLPGTLVSQDNDLYMCLGDECAETVTCEYRENGQIDKTVFKTRTCSHDMQHYTGLRDECPVGKCRIDERHRVKKTCHQDAEGSIAFNGEIGVAAGQCERKYEYSNSTAIFSGTACTDASDCETQCSADADCEGWSDLGGSYAYGALTAASGGTSKQRDDATLAIEVTEDCTSSASVHCSDPEQVTTKTYGYASSVKVFDGASCSDLADCKQQCTDDPSCEGYTSACSLVDKTTADTCGTCNVTGKSTELTCGTCVGDTSKETEAMCVSECQDSSFTTEATCGTCDDTNEGSSTTCVDTCYDYSSSVKVFDGASCSDLADCQQQCTDDPSCEGYTSACSLVDKTTQDTCGTCNVPGKSTELTCGTCNGDASKETEATCGTCPEDPSKLTSTTCVDTCYDYNSSLKVFSGSNCTDPSDCKTQCSADVDCEGFTSTCSDTSRAGTEADCGCSNPSITTESDCVTFQQLAASSGSSHTCAVLNDDTVKCWGSGSNGRLGYGDTSTRGNQANQMGNNLPTVDLGTGKTAKQVSASYEHTCAVLNDDTVKCWGKGNYGQLGYGDTNSRGDSGASATSCDDGKQMGDCLPVVDLGVNKTAKQVAAGGYHTCAILNDDTVKCWGAGNSGQLGYGGTSYKYSPPTATVDLGTCGTSTCLAKKIIAGSTHTCAVLNDDTVKCWGRGYYGQLGYGNTNNQNSPPTETVDLGTCGSSNCTAKQLVAGWHHTCAVLNDDTVKCWGHGESGKLGYGDTNNRGDSGAGATSCNEGKEMGDCLPTVDLGTCGSSSCTAKQVVPGRIHTCAVLNDDTVKCWGLGEYGRLGYGDTNSRGDSGASATSCNQGKEMGDCLPTVDLGTGKTAKQVVAGYYHTCAVLNDDTVKCWGWGGNGQLGNGSPDDKLSPPAATVDIGVLVTWSELSYTYGSQTADSGGTSEALVEVDCSGTIPRRINRTWTSSSWTAGTWDLATWNAQLSSAYAYGTKSADTGGTSQVRSDNPECVNPACSDTSTNPEACGSCNFDSYTTSTECVQVTPTCEVSAAPTPPDTSGWSAYVCSSPATSGTFILNGDCTLSAEVSLTGDLTIVGSSQDMSALKTMTAASTKRHFKVDGQLTLELWYVKLTGGDVSSHSASTDPSLGGAIFTSSSNGNTNTVNVYFSEISGNKAYNGGGIYSRGYDDNQLSLLNIRNSIVKDNVATSTGGGINGRRASITIMDTTIDNNEAANGGGLLLDFSVSTVTNTIISNNEAANGGAITIMNVIGATILRQVTFDGNEATSSFDEIFGWGNDEDLFLINTVMPSDAEIGDFDGSSTPTSITCSDNPCTVAPYTGACAAVDANNDILGVTCALPSGYGTNDNTCGTCSDTSLTTKTTCEASGTWTSHIWTEAVWTPALWNPNRFNRTWSALSWTQRDWQVGSWENGEWNAQLSSAYAYGTKSADTGGTSQERSLDQTTVQYKRFCPSGTSTSSVSCFAMELSNNQSTCPSTHVYGSYAIAYEPSCTASDYKTCEAVAQEDETLCLEQGCVDGSTKDKAACEAAGETYDSSTAANVFYHTEQVNSEAECDGEHTWGYKKFTIRV